MPTCLRPFRCGPPDRTGNHALRPLRSLCPSARPKQPKACVLRVLQAGRCNAWRGTTGLAIDLRHCYGDERKQVELRAYVQS